MDEISFAWPLFFLWPFSRFFSPDPFHGCFFSRPAAPNCCGLEPRRAAQTHGQKVLMWFLFFWCQRTQECNKAVSWRNEWKSLLLHTLPLCAGLLSVWHSNEPQQTPPLSLMAPIRSDRERKISSTLVTTTNTSVSWPSCLLPWIISSIYAFNKQIRLHRQMTSIFKVKHLANR